MTISSMDGLVAGLVSGPKFRVYKFSDTAKAAGAFHSLWKVANGAGATPPAKSAGSGYSPDDSTAGSLGTFVNPTSPAQTYWANCQGSMGAVNTLYVYDRLWHCSGFDTTVTSAQTITTPGTLPTARNPNAGADVEPWIEIYSAPGATGATWTITGTDAAANAAVTWVYTHPASAEVVNQIVPMTKGTASTKGINSAPTQLQCSISSGTAGNIGITLMRCLATIPIPAATTPFQLSALQGGLARIYDDSCLALVLMASGTSTGFLQLDAQTAQG